MLLRNVFGLGIRDIRPVPAAGGATPPTVDAGGPYSGFNGIAINGATLTPGSDASPSILWSVDGPAGTVATFTNGTTISPTFNWTTLNGTPITIRVTVTPNDGPAVFDTALVNIVG